MRVLFLACSRTWRARSSSLSEWLGSPGSLHRLVSSSRRFWTSRLKYSSGSSLHGQLRHTGIQKQLLHSKMVILYIHNSSCDAVYSHILTLLKSFSVDYIVVQYNLSWYVHDNKEVTVVALKWYVLKNLSASGLMSSYGNRGCFSSSSSSSPAQQQQKNRMQNFLKAEPIS